MSSHDLTAFYEWLALPPDELLAQCTRTPFQASGPGGQKRNRVYSAIRLEHPPTGLRAESGAHRESARNRADALRKLRLAMAITGAKLVPPVRPQTDSMSKESSSENPNRSTPVIADAAPPPKYPGFRAKISIEHRDFPATVLQALVAFRANGGEPRATAEGLDVSTSAFVKYLKLDKAVLAEANAIRRNLGKDSLR
ncbi:MAG: peptide chain release factor-like protein [bacterium]|nr:peptide chain release factor-like protein [bacterium]